MLFSVSHVFFYVVLIYGAIASDEEVFLITIYLRICICICIFVCMLAAIVCMIYCCIVLGLPYGVFVNF